MLFSEKLFEEVKDIWEDYCLHPFVDELGSGKLDKEKFKFYMIQDYLYLLDYAKVFSLGVAKSNEEKTMAKFSSLAEGTLNTEMKIHRNYMSKLGISNEEVMNTKMSLSNISYTHYMLAVSYTGDILDISVSVLSCLWSYEYIARYLYEKYGILDNFYSEWIEGYISKEYHELTVWLLNLVNENCKNISKAKEEKLKDIFINSSRFEKMFWDMAYNMEK